MKLSKNLKSKIKKYLTTTVVSSTIVLTALATFKLADFSAPFENINSDISIAENDKEVSSGNKYYSQDEETENYEIVNSNVNADNKINEAPAFYASSTYRSSVTVASDGAIVCDSIVQGTRDSNLADGDYVFRVTGTANGVQETKDYPVELINYYNNVQYSLASGETSRKELLGNDTADERMLIVKYHGDLIIDEGVTLTAKTRKKGMYIYVAGKTTNNGEITMTARGSSAEAENVYLWKNIDSSFEYIPVTGALALPARQPRYSTFYGVNGNNGTNRATGGGGQGGGIINTNKSSGPSWVGASSSGTSYAGGNGSGAIVRCNTSTLYAGSSQASSTSGGPR